MKPGKYHGFPMRKSEDEEAIVPLALKDSQGTRLEFKFTVTDRFENGDYIQLDEPVVIKVSAFLDPSNEKFESSIKRLKGYGWNGKVTREGIEFSDKFYDEGLALECVHNGDFENWYFASSRNEISGRTAKAIEEQIAAILAKAGDLPKVKAPPPPKPSKTPRKGPKRKPPEAPKKPTSKSEPKVAATTYDECWQFWCDTFAGEPPIDVWNMYVGQYEEDNNVEMNDFAESDWQAVAELAEIAKKSGADAAF